MNELRKKIIEAYGFTVQGNDVVKIHTKNCSGHDSPGYEVEFICKTFEFEPANKVIDAVIEHMKNFPSSPYASLTTHVFTATDLMVKWLKGE